MPLTAGTRLGDYEVVAPIGTGEARESYRAKDVRQEREVALRVLPAEIVHDPARMVRIQREAGALKSLDHPNIAEIYSTSPMYGTGQYNGVRALAVELVEGPTLAECMARGAIPLKEALGIALQIVDGLEAAHDKRVVHRNLTPANVKIMADGRVKLLDFGLASQEWMTPYGAAYTAPEQASRQEADRRADIWSFGSILFEMLTGRRAFPGETTSDVRMAMHVFEPDWSLLPAGTPPAIVTLVRRCLTKDRDQRLQWIEAARTAIASTMAELWPEEAEPEPEGSEVPAEAAPAAAAGAWNGAVGSEPKASAIPAAAPATVAVPAAGDGGRAAQPGPIASVAAPAETKETIASLLRRCLTLDGERRKQAIGEVGRAIADVIGETWPVSRGPKGLRIDWRWALAWSGPGILAGALLTWGVFRIVTGNAAPHVRRLSIALPAGETGGDPAPELALSPDGSQLVYSAVEGGKRRLYLRPLDAIDATAIPWTEGAMAPFFSPDGEWIGYFAQGSLKRVRVAGGLAETLCSGPFSERGLGGNWSKDGSIFFEEKRGLFRFQEKKSLLGLGDSERVCESLVTPDANGRAPGWPDVLPGGRGLLFSAYGGYDFNSAPIAALRLKERKWEAAGQEGTNPHYVAGGYVVYAQGASLMAAKFSLSRLKVTGPAVTMVDGVLTDDWEGKARFAIADDGTLAYIANRGGGAGRKVVLIDDFGRVKDLTASDDVFLDPAMSPDGQRIALRGEGAQQGLWIYEVGPGTRSRLTSGNEVDPCWTPDGKRLIYSAYRNGEYGLYLRPADWSEPEEELVSGPDVLLATSVAPDGKEVAYFERSGEIGGGSRIMILPLGGGGPRAFVSGSGHAEMPKFSPDGKSLAWESDESGQMEIYVERYPGPGEKRRVSNGGGRTPVWSRDGRELFYRNGDKVMAVPMETASASVAGAARVVSEGGYGMAFHDYDVMRGGKRFLAVQDAAQAQGARQIRVVFNWVEEMKWIVARGKNK